MSENEPAESRALASGLAGGIEIAAVTAYVVTLLRGGIGAVAVTAVAD